jgi:hypothetical protein
MPSPEGGVVSVSVSETRYCGQVMPPPPLPFDAPSESNRYAKVRDERILWLLAQHPVTAAMLVDLGWFPNRNKALKRLRRLAQRRRIRLVGTVCRKTGRPEHVYCRYRPKADSLLHEVELTALCLRLHAGRILRGPHVTDAAVRPDAEAWINGVVYYLECDRGTMGYPQIVRDRFRKYRNCPHLCLWVCSTEARREGLRGRAECVRSTALFATMADALVSPHGAIWRDYSGNTATLPRETPDGPPPDGAAWRSVPVSEPGRGAATGSP